ncbi:MAG: tripartite tricarboxylate transporter substrate-binding protein [Phenylobacterium sp.]|jgi:putative tricarboxylic transport membrane protein|uniref:tripartite tricarboxylate transporter substrate-binding protein n=1 Tax=Phenylobacterium sp. TaxID=1871053 RepID=UPI002A36D7FF|nr:tripartite tricarboxylate transporter substrate-binding protein [Phenylobacterium sp.]MDX9999224.1 tripartite tricarboxylate transporter substrate-binding protein [Phenylobacterium sp.]
MEAGLEAPPATPQAVTRRAALAGGLALAAAPMAAGAASDFPSRPLVILAPANPGGGWDQLARLMQRVIAEEGLSPKPIEVINRGGAGGAIGLAELVSRRHGDPYTIMAAGSVMVGSTIAQNSPFRVTDTDPLARLIIEHLIVAVPATSPYQTIDEFLAAFRENPGEVTWCGGSAGGVDHILVGLIGEAAGVPADAVRYVAYSGGGEASAAIMGGQVTAGVAGYSEWRGLAEAGRIRILASAAAERFGDRALPTLREAGLNVVLENWRGVFAPPGLKEHEIAWWMSVLERMRASDLWRQYLARNGWEDGFLARGAFRDFIVAEEALNTRTLARLGIVGSSGGYSPVGPWAFPTAIGVAAAAAGAALVVERVRRPEAVVAPAASEEDDGPQGPPPTWGRFLAGAALALAYIAALGLVGFVVATPVFVVALCLLMRSRTLVWDAAVAVALTGAVWLLFTKLLSVHLP